VGKGRGRKWGKEGGEREVGGGREEEDRAARSTQCTNFGWRRGSGQTKGGSQENKQTTDIRIDGRKNQKSWHWFAQCFIKGCEKGGKILVWKNVGLGGERRKTEPIRVNAAVGKGAYERGHSIEVWGVGSSVKGLFEGTNRV